MTSSGICHVSCWNSCQCIKLTASSISIRSDLQFTVKMPIYGIIRFVALVSVFAAMVSGVDHTSQGPPGGGNQGPPGSASPTQFQNSAQQAQATKERAASIASELYGTLRSIAFPAGQNPGRIDNRFLLQMPGTVLNYFNYFPGKDYVKFVQVQWMHAYCNMVYLVASEYLYSKLMYVTIFDN